MLNELLAVERGARKAGLEITDRHPDIQATARRTSALCVRLDQEGRVAGASPVPDDAGPWTLRNHNKNSFPFVQIRPLLDDDAVAKWKTWTETQSRPKSNDVRTKLLQLGASGELRRGELGEWGRMAVMVALRHRLAQVGALDGTDAAVLPAALRRFLLACDPEAGGDAARFLESVRSWLLDGLTSAATEEWIRCSTALLVAGKGALWIDADGQWPRTLLDKRILRHVNSALTTFDASGDAITGKCGLSGQHARLVRDTFPRADLPIIGPTILFSRFEGDPSKERYGRFGRDSMPVSEEVSRSLAATATALTTPERKGITWRGVPGETPKQVDLLLAFVQAVPDAPAAAMLTEGDANDDYSEEFPVAVPEPAESVAVFEKRTERLIDAVLGKVAGDFRQTPVHLAVLRKVDPANRKVVYVGAPTVGELHEAATAWAAGERNVPPWLVLPVLPKGEQKSRPMAPPHVAPLGVVGLSKQIFLRGGKRPEGKKKEQVGMPATEALELFLASPLSSISVQLRVNRILRLVLARRTTLLIGVPHVQHAPRCWKYRHDRARKLDHREALRTVTMLGLLLYKLGRTKEDYMNDTAFRLGQFLAAADVVHAGYCADLRGGDVPPSLLGNQVLTMAQSAPVRALAILSRRWKPYDGWAKKAARKRDRSDKLVQSKDEVEVQRGWDIRNAVQHARRMGPLAAELGVSLLSCAVNDAFRAELLLGYIAGLPKTPKENGGGADGTNDNANISGEEE